MMISRPLRVACGSGEPHSRQNDVEKLRASGQVETRHTILPGKPSKGRWQNVGVCSECAAARAATPGAMTLHKHDEGQVGLEFHTSAETSTTHGHVRSPLSPSTSSRLIPWPAWRLLRARSIRHRNRGSICSRYSNQLFSTFAAFIPDARIVRAMELPSIVDNLAAARMSALTKFSSVSLAIGG
jgi:hypothetical protein